VVAYWCKGLPRLKLPAAAFYLAVCLFAHAQQSKLGHIEFPTSGSAEAQQHFVQGVLLLHSFEYSDAREEFQAAARLEPRFAMAYWGEALTYTHPIWVQQDTPAARAALAHLASTPDARLELAPTEREKDYLRSVEVLYGEGDKVSRDIAYANAMHRMMKKYPDDLEAASLYAVALLGTCQYERQAATYMRAAAVAEEVFAKNPQHPGAIHYLIHAYDDPIHAPLGLRPARVYGKIAGSASHAQHMPSHIFFALGMWDEAIAANEASVEVADERVKRKGLSPSERNYHSLLWLEYAYLQEGRVAAARQLLSGIQLPRQLSHMRATYAVETGDWDRSPADLDLSHGDVLTNVAALGAEGLVDVAHGRLAEARECAVAARKEIDSSADHDAAANHGSMPMADPPNTRKLAQIMSRQVEAAILHAEGKADKAFALLAQTATDEDALGFEFGPPMPLKPTRELYGELLLQASQPDEARRQFERVLQRTPGRALSLQGLARAQADAGDKNAAAETLAQLSIFWRGDRALKAK
jgi:tetratricopeptide (TPR) repeat protein